VPELDIAALGETQNTESMRRQRGFRFAGTPPERFLTEALDLALSRNRDVVLFFGNQQIPHAVCARMFGIIFGAAARPDSSAGFELESDVAFQSDFAAEIVSRGNEHFAPACLVAPVYGRLDGGCIVGGFIGARAVIADVERGGAK